VSDDSISARAYRPTDTSPSLFTSLNARFILLATLSAVTVVAFAIVAGAGLSSLSKSNQAIQQIAQVIQRHMDGDMMHDAINSDVMKAELQQWRKTLLISRPLSRASTRTPQPSARMSPII
jgi:demethoxyubiquinone hydroxylase (CLK1/Coq7/Cat5 family)